MAYVTRKDLFTTKPAYVEICMDKGPRYGRTVCDFYGISGKEPNALVGTGIDLPEFWNFIEENLKRLN
mgnify:CR=1 FL=1